MCHFRAELISEGQCQYGFLIHLKIAYLISFRREHNSFYELIHGWTILRCFKLDKCFYLVHIWWVLFKSITSRKNKMFIILRWQKSIEPNLFMLRVVVSQYLHYRQIKFSWIHLWALQSFYFSWWDQSSRWSVVIWLKRSTEKNKIGNWRERSCNGIGVV